MLPAGESTVVPPDGPPRAARLRPRALLEISLLWFAINLHWGALLTVLLPAQVAAMRPDAQAQTLGLVLGLGALVALVVTPLAGALSDRCASRFGRRRPFIVTGVLINAAGLAVMAAAFARASFEGYLAGFLVVQLGNNIAGGAYAGFIPDLVAPLQRGEASGWMAAMTQLGTVGGALLGGVLQSSGNSSACYGVIVATLLGLMLVTLLTVRETPLSSAPPPVSPGRLLADMWIDPRQHTDFAWVWMTRFLAISGIWMVQPFLLYYLRDVIGVADPAMQTGVMMAVMLVGATFTGWLAGLWSDRFGRKVVVYAANGTLAMAVLLLLASHSLGFTLAVGAIFGLGYGAWYSVDWALVCDVLPDQENAGRYLGVWNVAMVLPQSIAPLMAGALLSAAGSGAVEGRYEKSGYVAVFVASAVTLAMAAWLLRRVRTVR